MLKEFTIDLADAPDDLAASIEDVQRAEEKLLETVAEKFPEEGFDHEGCPQDYENKFYELREQQAELEQRRSRIVELLEEPDQAGNWSHYRFTFREPSTEDALFVQGRSNALAEEAAERGEFVDEEMFGLSELLDRCRVDGPPEAPTNLTDALPNPAGEWLFNQVNEKTTMGVEGDLGNTSPQEALNNYKSSQDSSTPDRDDHSENSPSETPSSSPTSGQQ